MAFAQLQSNVLRLIIKSARVPSPLTQHIAFWRKHVEGEVKLGWEHTEYKWITLNEAVSESALEHFHQCFERIKKLKQHLPNDFAF